MVTTGAHTCRYLVLSCIRTDHSLCARFLIELAEFTEVLGVSWLDQGLLEQFLLGFDDLCHSGVGLLHQVSGLISFVEELLAIGLDDFEDIKVT
jgi:hypothetical protein